MTREDVREYLLERLTTIVHDAKIDYVKWDMNRNITKLGNGKTYLKNQDAIPCVYLGPL